MSKKPPKIFSRTKKKRTKELEKIPYAERKPASRTLKLLHPADQTSYFFYRKHRKIKSYIGEDRTVFRQVATSIYFAVAELLQEYEGGVHLSKYGYFVPIVLPWIEGGYKDKYQFDPYFHTDGRFYSLSFFYDVSNNSCLHGMYMDYQFDWNLRTLIGKRIYAGFRPKFYYTTLKTMFGRKPHPLKKH